MTLCRMCKDRQALYARPGQKPRYCGPCCVGKNMVDVVHDKCLCGKHPVYGVSGEKAVCCKECKKPGMVDVVNKKCPCGHQMNYGLPGGKATCCNTCKKPGMINVVSNKCPCGTVSVFGFFGEKAVCCSECKKPGMVDVVAKLCPCGKHPVYGVPDGKAECCKECKKPGMVDVVGKTCPGYNSVPCPVVTYIKYGQEYCLVCDPDQSRRTARLKDETAFFDFLAENDVNVTQRSYRIEYRCIDTFKTRSEIDGVIVAADVIVCLELDEDAHENYDPTCEEARMHDASAELKIAFPDRPIAWIRVNPHIKKDGRRDVSRRARKIRDERHHEALVLIHDVLENPRDCIEYVGY
jgi:hypothetical protein